MSQDILQDVRATAPAERLLEDSWSERSRRAPRRELVSESAAAIAFLIAAALLAVLAGVPRGTSAFVCAVLVVVFAAVSRTARFPVGTGWVVPSYLVLVPMLLIAPAALAPLLACAGLVLGGATAWVLGRARRQDVLFSIPDAWAALGPAAVLALAEHGHRNPGAGALVLAFAAGCLLDLLVSTLREWLISGVPPRLHLQIVLRAWLLDGCFAPMGFGVAVVARHHLAGLALLGPICVLLALADTDRTARIARAQDRLAVLARERTRLQMAVQRLGDAFAAQLDLGALVDVLLRSSVEALDAAAGRLTLGELVAPLQVGAVDPGLDDLLAAAIGEATRGRATAEVDHDAGWAYAVSIVVPGADRGALAVARADRAFSDDERRLIAGLARRAERATAEIIAHDALRRQARTDALTGLGNRRDFAEALDDRLAAASADHPLLLAILDLNGFKAYNDSHGHPAGDALLARFGQRLGDAVAPDGSAYRLGGDEFCVLTPATSGARARLDAATAPLADEGAGVAISASCGSILVPGEAQTAQEALALADRRMYDDKHARRSGDVESFSAVRARRAA